MSALKTAKSVTVKLGRAERRAVRVQRRIWLAQLLMWPALGVVGVVGAVVVVRTARARRAQVTTEPVIE
ncbi:hypothetical protein BH10ACT9_BH10ACT9_00100 [soil metagenome]